MRVTAAAVGACPAAEPGSPTPVSVHRTPDPADPYQYPVYGAEEAALPDGGRRFTRFAHLEAWVTEVVTGDWWSETWPQAPVEVAVQHRGVAVHELAHLTSWWHPPSEGPHGATFAADLLVLWRHLLGAHAYGALRSAFDEREVPYRLDRLERSAR